MHRGWLGDGKNVPWWTALALLAYVLVVAFVAIELSRIFVPLGPLEAGSAVAYLGWSFDRRPKGDA